MNFNKQKFFRLNKLNLAFLVLAPITSFAQFGPGVDPAALEAVLEEHRSMTTPRNSEGHPDLSGHWAAPSVGGGGGFFGSGVLSENENGEINIFPEFINNTFVNAQDVANVDRRRENKSLRPVYKPEHQVQADVYFENSDLNDPGYGCGLPGVPRIGMPTEIVQTDDTVYLLYENLVNRFRVIPLDGREHNLASEPVPNGDAIAYWEGDTLIIDVINISDDTWVDRDGSIHSEEMHVIERLTREGDVLTYALIVEDPYFSEPFMPQPMSRILSEKGTHVGVEWPCFEISLDNMVNGTKH
ncbi:MAG: hypothetical protein COA71_12950 [SAR86 cluster bacterium]|uniref:Uncharacterized protein n=1 Tax=SAR86 cluster bacterium TaxID=2030880 RepID=A0A2A5C7E3_9GAMM|nr:MAG: hypothetical protein COA71_12950 [SAR86 cluster bacterium]